jgi:hypothetical protein
MPRQGDAAMALVRTTSRHSLVSRRTRSSPWSVWPSAFCPLGRDVYCLAEKPMAVEGRRRDWPIERKRGHQGVDLHESVDPSIDGCWFRALAIDKRVGAHSAHGKARTEPIESRRAVDCHACARAPPSGHDLPKAQGRVAGPTRRLPRAGMLVKRTGPSLWADALSTVGKCPFCNRVHTFVVGPVGKRPFCSGICWHRG